MDKLWNSREESGDIVIKLFDTSAPSVILYETKAHKLILTHTRHVSHARRTLPGQPGRQPCQAGRHAVSIYTFSPFFVKMLDNDQNFKETVDQTVYLPWHKESCLIFLQFCYFGNFPLTVLNDLGDNGFTIGTELGYWRRNTLQVQRGPRSVRYIYIS